MASQPPPDPGLLGSSTGQPGDNPLFNSQNFPTVTNIANTIGDAVGDVLPGTDFILELVRDVSRLPALLSSLLTDVEGADPGSWVTTLVKQADKIKDVLDNSIVGEYGKLGAQLAGDFSTAVPTDNAAWNWLAEHSVGLFFRGMLETGLGVDTSKFDADAQRGVNTTDTMLAFAFAMPYIGAAADHIGALFLGNRWPKTLSHTLETLSTEMGLSWALGLIIDESFKVAVGSSIEEGINRQKRGNRIAWQQLRVLLKQHLITEDKLVDLLKNQGFPDEQIEWLRKLADNQIPVGDIAQLYYRETIDEARVKELVGELGFNAEQTDWLTELYVTKAETQASVTYRSIAKNMYINHLISEDQYRTILTESNFPKRMIDQDIAGITLEQSTGHLLETVALVKSEYLHKQIDPSEATRRLGLLNYAPSYIAQLINSWDQPPIKAKHGLSTAKVLSYMISGLITPDQARPMLQSNGVDDATVEFLLIHPTANTGAKQHALSPGLVTQAYMDGAVTLSDLAAAYTRAGVASANLDYYVNIAKYKFSHKRGNAGYTQAVTAGEWRQAYKVGLIDFSTLVTELESVGYTPDGALLLAEIENKGPYQPPQPPAFATLSDALAYITAAGYVISPPTDPRLLAAENMAAVAGYTWQRSTTFPGIPGGGGVPPGGTFPPPATPPPTPPPGPGGPVP